MIIIDKTKKAPKYVRPDNLDPSFFKNEYERDKHNAEEQRRWIEGYKGLTGFHYWYLTRWVLKDIRTYKPIHPFWREDDDDLIFKPLQYCQDNWQDFILFKRRRASWSSVSSALAVYLAIIKYGITILYTSADLDRILEFYNGKLIFGFSRMKLMEESFNIEEKHIVSKSGGIFMNITDKDDREAGTSQIKSYETVKDPRSFEGEMSGGIILDEMGLHTKLTTVWGSADACRMDGQVRMGLIYAGGTCGDMTNNAANKLQDMMKNADKLDLITSFYLGYHGISEIEGEGGKHIKCTINGYTNHKLALEAIERKREKLWQMDDKTRYWEHYKAYPITREEIFDAVDKSDLPEDIKMNLQAQQKIILKSKIENKGQPLFKRYSIKENDLAEDSNGFWHILKYPQKDHVYGLGTDPIAGESASKEGSMYAAALKDFTDNIYVGFYLRRLDSLIPIVREVIAAQILYHNCENLMEMEKGATSNVYYYEWGHLDLLAATPKSFPIKHTYMPHGKGFNAKTLGKFGDSLVLEYAKEDYAQWLFEPAIQDMFKWGTKNNQDIKDAMRACELLHKEYENNRGQVEKNQTETFEIMTVVGGRLQKVTIKREGKTATNWTRR